MSTIQYRLVDVGMAHIIQAKWISASNVPYHVDQDHQLIM